MILKILAVLLAVFLIGIFSLWSMAVTNSQSEPESLPSFPTSGSQDNQVIICPPGETDPANCYNSYRDG